MAFKIKTVVSFLNLDGSVAKPDHAREWDGLTKMEVVQMERCMAKALMKANAFSLDVVGGRAKKFGNTNPLNMRYVAEVTEDGKPWAASSADWYGIGDEGQAFLIGLLEGEIGNLDAGIRGKEKGKGHSK